MANKRRPYQSCRPEMFPPLGYEETTSQALRVIHKFGGVRNLAIALSNVGKRYNPSSIYRWTYPRSEGGAGGVIPTKALPDVHLAARLEGILLDNSDFDPRVNPNPQAHPKTGPKPLPRDKHGNIIRPTLNQKSGDK
jgi:hypothetical protein